MDNTEKKAEEKTVEQKVKEIIVDKLGIDPVDVKNEATFRDLSADSLDTAELVMEFEKEFDLAISDSDMEKFLTVGDAIEYIKVHTDQK